jgi:hypothetical protein
MPLLLAQEKTHFYLFHNCENLKNIERDVTDYEKTPNSCNLAFNE